MCSAGPLLVYMIQKRALLTLRRLCVLFQQRKESCRSSGWLRNQSTSVGLRRPATSGCLVSCEGSRSQSLIHPLLIFNFRTNEIERTRPLSFVCSISFVRFRSFDFVRSISFVRFRSFDFVRSISFVRFRSFDFVRFRSFDFVRSISFVRFRSFDFVRSISFVRFRSFDFVRSISFDFVRFRSFDFVRSISFVQFRSFHFVRSISFVTPRRQCAIAAFFVPCPL